MNLYFQVDWNSDNIMRFLRAFDEYLQKSEPLIMLCPHDFPPYSDFNDT